MSRRIVPVLLVVVGGCFGFDDLEARALSALDGGAAGGASGGMAGGVAGGASGGMAGGASGGIAGGTSGGTAGGTAGGADAGALPPCSQADAGLAATAACSCFCSVPPCASSCALRISPPAAVRSDFRNLVPVALASTHGVAYLVDDTGLLSAISPQLTMSFSVNTNGPFKSLDARRGRALAVFTGSYATESSAAEAVFPSTVTSCHGGAIYEDLVNAPDAGVQEVVVCRFPDAGLRAVNRIGSGLSNGPEVPLPSTGFESPIVQVRPDENGSVGRYLVSRDGGGSPWRYSFFANGSIGPGVEFFANQALLATSEGQQAVMGLRTDNGVFLARNLGRSSSVDAGAPLVPGPFVNLRGLATFEGTPGPVDVFLLERSGMAGTPTFRGFELNSVGVTDWFVVIDRPGRVVVHRLGGGIERAFVARWSDTEVLVVARCTLSTGSELCSGSTGTAVERLRID